MPGTIFIDVEAGIERKYAIDEDGNLWGWGGDTGYHHEVLGAADGNVTTPTKILTNIKKVYADCDVATYAITKEGRVYAWGSNKRGQLGNGTTTYSATPTIVSGLTNVEELCVTKSNLGDIYLTGANADNDGYVIAKDTSGHLWSWGNQENYGLGYYSSSPQTTPYQFSSISYKKVVATNSGCAFAIDTEGNLYGWGSNTNGELGNGTVNRNSTPMIIKSGTKFKDVAVTEESVGLIDSLGRFWTCGKNGYGELANEKISSTYTPILISTTARFENIQNGTYNFYLTDTNGDIWGVGLNDGFEFAIGNVTNQKSLIQITGYKENCTVIFKNGETVLDTQIITNGSSATAPTPTKAGYTLSWDKDFSNVTSDITVNAVWTSNTNTAYKVEYYKQNIALNGYTLEETENLTGTTDTTKTATSKTYPGFTENTTYSERKASGTVSGDGSLVLKLYYDRNSYTVALNTNSGTINSGNITSYTYGIAQTLPINVTKTGYTFGGWYDNSNCTGSSTSYITSTDTGNKTYYAKWTANANTAYKVVHQKMNLDGTTYTTEETENLTGTTGAGVTPAVKTYTGFTSPSTQTTTIAADGSTTVTYKYTRNKYNFTLGSCDGVTTTGSSASGSYYYGTTITLKATVSNGYTWNKWSNGTTSNNTTLTMPANTLTCTPQATLNNYTIAYELNGGIVDTSASIGTGNPENPTTYTVETATFTLINPIKTGYTFIGWTGSNGTTPQTSVSISKGSTGDKSFTANWKTDNCEVIFKNGDNILKTETVNYGSSATAPTPTKQGYTLSWDKSFTNVTSNITVNAVWTANTNTAYKVEHYQQTTDTEVIGYSVFETENLTGTTDTTATASTKTYEGFTVNPSNSQTVLSGNIAGDGSLTLKLYYDRNIYNINYELDGGTATGTLTSTYMYGKQLVLSTKVTKAGYVFGGWYDNSELTGDDIKQISTIDTGDKTFYAKWLKQDEYYLTSNKHTVDNTENFITQISPNTDVDTFTKNITTNGNIKILNSKREEIGSSDLVGTGHILQVEFNGTTHEYQLVVKGDIDGNGKLSVTDLAMVNQAIVGRITLQGPYEKASDLDSNKKLSVTDLAMINQAIVGRINL